MARKLMSRIANIFGGLALLLGTSCVDSGFLLPTSKEVTVYECEAAKPVEQRSKEGEEDVNGVIRFKAEGLVPNAGFFSNGVSGALVLPDEDAPFDVRVEYTAQPDGRIEDGRIIINDNDREIAGRNSKGIRLVGFQAASILGRDGLYVNSDRITVNYKTDCPSREQLPAYPEKLEAYFICEDGSRFSPSDTLTRPNFRIIITVPEEIQKQSGGPVGFHMRSLPEYAYNCFYLADYRQPAPISGTNGFYEVRGAFSKSEDCLISPPVGYMSPSYYEAHVLFNGMTEDVTTSIFVRF
jgi:hypothetical protein